MKYTIAILCILALGKSYGQSSQNYQDGYVVLLNGDTLTGKVMDRNESAFGGLLNKIKFRPEKGWKKKYKPSQLQYYQRGSNRFKSIWLSTESRILRQSYYSKPGEGEQVFVQLVHDGSIDLYHWEYTDEDNSSIDFVPLIKKTDSNELVRPTQGILGLKRKRLAEYFADCPRLSSAITLKQVTTTEEVINFYENQCAQ